MHDMGDSLSLNLNLGHFSDKTNSLVVLGGLSEMMHVLAMEKFPAHIS